MRSKKYIGIASVLLLTLLILILGVRWVHFRLTHAVTNAVFVETETFTKVAYRRVGGKIVKLYKEEGDRVEAGEALAKVEDRDIRLKLEEIREKKRKLRENLKALTITRDRVLEELRERDRALLEKIGEVRARIEGLRIRIDQAQRDRDRFERLFRRGVVPSRRFEEVNTQLLALRKEEEALIKVLRSIEAERRIVRIKMKQVEEIERKIAALRHELKAISKRERDLENLLEETVLRSPIGGYVVKRYVSLGEVVRPGQYVYAVYDPKDLYVLVLLEETKLRGVRKGNRVIIEIDAFPDEKFEGVVKEIGKAVASKFALIPRDITAGEFTKVVQRVPVKVEITKGPKEILRVGMGGNVAIERR